MREELRELWRYRELLKQLVERELKIRYKNSALGFLWSIVPPLMQVLIFSFLYNVVLGVKIPNYSAYLLSAMLPWTFFTAAIQDSSDALLGLAYVIKKIYMPREVVPLSKVISNFIHFLLGWLVYFVAFLVVAPLLGIGGIKLIPTMWLFPILVLMELLLVSGIALWVAALNVFYQDVKFILMTLFQLLFFVLPVLFPSDMVYYNSRVQQHPWLYQLYMLNPITALIEGFRKSLLEPLWPGMINPKYAGAQALNYPPLPLQWQTLLPAFCLCLLIAWGGYAYFNSRKWRFVEKP